MNPTQIFKDEGLNAELWEHGYVIMPFLSAEELKTLLEASRQFIPDDVNHFFATSNLPDLEVRKQARDIMMKVIASSSQQHFDQGHPLGGAFIAKPSHGRGQLTLHQDWNIVDEQEHRSYNIWIPLVDTSAENGAFHALPGSHNKEFTIRGPGIAEIWNGMEADVQPHMKCLDMKAGEALIYDHALWHYSPPNRSELPRPAVVLGMVAKDTPLLAYFEEDGRIAEYASSANYFFEEPDISQPTTLEKRKEFDHHNPQLTPEKLKSLYLSHSNGQDQNLSSKSTYQPKDVGQFYDAQTFNFLKVYGQVIQAFRTSNVTDLLDYQIESIGLKAGMKVLDAGCGVCGPARYFARKMDIQIEAVTISQKQVELSQVYIRQEDLNDRVNVQQGDFQKLSGTFEAESFDVAYFLESFGHASDHKKAILESWKVLKPGGILYIKDLFIKEGVNTAHDHQIANEIENINRAYRYNVADLYKILAVIRKQGFILSSLKTIDLPLEQFENLTISNDFQELTGINKIDNLSDYIFPVDFFELKCIKPWNSLEKGNNRYFLQNQYYMQIKGKTEGEL